jgi:heme-degrading monooxygenase HmoA
LSQPTTLQRRISAVAMNRRQIMESAIPEHLRRPRSQVRRAPEGYVPPVPAWVARFGSGVSRVVMGYFGVQFRGAAGEDVAGDFIRRCSAWCADTDGPGSHELTQYPDNAGFDVFMMIAYWRDLETHDRWMAATQRRDWWEPDQRESEGVGYFREIFSPRLPHFETLFSSPDRFEVVARLTASVSDQIIEHGYWAWSHPTHVAIFGSFMRMVKATNFQPRLRLYHEVAVLAENEQHFEYVNCHPSTGMLASVAAVPAD